MNDNVRYAEKINELVEKVNAQELELVAIRRLHSDMQESRWFRLWFRAYLRKLPAQRRPIRPMDIPPVLNLPVSVPIQKSSQLRRTLNEIAADVREEM